MRTIFNITTLLGLFFLYSFALLAAEEKAPDSLIHLGKGPFYSNHVFIVDKSKRTLTVWEQNDTSYNKIKEFVADFGKNGGDKVSKGDYKTPEGIYFFQTYLDNANLNFQEYGYHEVKAFPMNYPNLFDKREGKTGNGIWLHTLPDNMPLNRGSRGCVVIRNNDFTEVSKLIKINNTPIMVHDQVNYVPVTQLKDQNDQVVAWLKKWLEAWQTKNLTGYMSFYSDSFRSKGMDYAGWEQYKKGLSDTYGDIEILISEPRIVHFRDEWIVQFIQKYKSDKYEDLGHKTLFIKGTGSDLKIIAEDFDVTDSNIAIAQFDAGNFGCCTEDRKITTTKN